jgi:hypothetical protein
VLGDRLAAGSPRSFAIAAVAGGLMGIVLMFVGMLVFSGVAFRATTMGDDALVRSVVDTGNMLIECGKYGFAVLILATCAAPGATSFLTRRMKTLGLVAAVILILSTAPPFLTDHGIGQFGGGIDLVGGVPGFVWIIAVSVAMTRRAVVSCA